MPLPDLTDLDWDSVTAWLRDLDWGSLPAWAGALSLLLAFRIFVRDHGNAERVQVDQVGAWSTTTYERRPPEERRRAVVVATARLYVRNASVLPVVVERLDCRIETTWVVKSEGTEPSYKTVAGTKSEERSVQGVTVAPNDKWESPEGRFDLTDTAPEGATQLFPVEGVRSVLTRLLLLDNAGRRWEVRPTKASRAKKVSRYRHRRIQKEPTVLWELDWS